MADDPDQKNQKPDPDKDDPKPDQTKTPDLGDAGKKALEEERKARRDAEKQLKELGAKLKTLEDKDKSDLDKLRDQVATVTKERDEHAAKALRLEVAAEKGVKARWLSGSTREELEAVADEYLQDHPPAKGATPPPTSKPNPDLKGGGDPTGDDEVDGDKIAEKILAKRTI